MQSLFGSSIPNERIAALFGTQYQKAALRVVPPRSGAFSRRRTSFPNHRENKAAESPPAPDPTTTISTSASKPFGRVGADEPRFAIWREEVITNLPRMTAALRALYARPGDIAPVEKPHYWMCYRLQHRKSYKNCEL
jgi:hypothetical protein